jgi:hypothetical protein
MSESKRLGRWEYFRSAVTGKGPDLMDQYGKQGLKIILFPGFFIRQEILLRQRMVLENRLLDMVDRVHEGDTLLFAAGLPYARGGERDSSAWSVSWEHWREEMFCFDDHASQRSWYKTETLLEIEEAVPSSEVKTQDDGTSRVEVKMVPVTRQVRQDTFDALRVVDAHLLEAKERPEGWAPTKLLGRTEVKPAEGIEQLKKATGYDPVAAEESIRIYGNEMLMWASVVLNRSFRDKDTPSQTGDIIYMNQQQGDRGRTFEYPGQSVPRTPAETGVHK